MSKILTHLTRSLHLMFLDTQGQHDEFDKGSGDMNCDGACGHGQDGETFDEGDSTGVGNDGDYHTEDGMAHGDGDGDGVTMFPSKQTSGQGFADGYVSYKDECCGHGNVESMYYITTAADAVDVNPVSFTSVGGFRMLSLEEAWEVTNDEERKVLVQWTPTVWAQSRRS